MTQEISNKIREAINKGHITMKPRWHFVLRAALIVLGAVLLSLALLFVVSLAVFLLHRSGVWFVPVFGLRGLREFLQSLPWLFLLVALIFVILLELLVRRYAFVYRRSLLFSVGLVLLLILAGSLVVSQFGFHEMMFRRAAEGRLPLGGRFYVLFDQPAGPNTTFGIIAEMNEDGFNLNGQGQFFRVFITGQTRLPFGADFDSGDRVVVFGPRGTSTIAAWGIREVPGDKMFFPVPPPGKPGRGFHMK